MLQQGALVREGEVEAEVARVLPEELLAQELPHAARIHPRLLLLLLPHLLPRHGCCSASLTSPRHQIGHAGVSGQGLPSPKEGMQPAWACAGLLDARTAHQVCRCQHPYPRPLPNAILQPAVVSAWQGRWCKQKQRRSCAESASPPPATARSCCLLQDRCRLPGCHARDSEIAHTWLALQLLSCCC